MTHNCSFQFSSVQSFDRLGRRREDTRDDWEEILFTTDRHYITEPSRVCCIQSPLPMQDSLDTFFFQLRHTWIGVLWNEKPVWLKKKKSHAISQKRDHRRVTQTTTRQWYKAKTLTMERCGWVSVVKPSQWQWRAYCIDGSHWHRVLE